MPEGHTTHALAGRLNHAFAGAPVAVSSPQGRFSDGAALLDGLTLVEAAAWGKHLFVEFEQEHWLNVHLGLIGKFSVLRHHLDRDPALVGETSGMPDGRVGPAGRVGPVGQVGPFGPVGQVGRVRSVGQVGQVGQGWQVGQGGQVGQVGLVSRGGPVGPVPVAGQVRLRLLNGTWVGDLRGPTVCAVITPDKVDEIQARLGPDPLRSGADPDLALRRLQRSARPIAELLMDQSVLAGVGNVYRCEVLFRHRVDPFRPGQEIRPRTWRAIWDDLVALMPLGVAFGQILTMADQVADAMQAMGEDADGSAAAFTAQLTGARLGERYERRFSVYKRTGQPCHVCGSKIRTQLVAGRNLFWCGRCQRRR